MLKYKNIFNIIGLISSLLLGLLIEACSQHTSESNQALMGRASEIMESNPEGALAILDSVVVNDLHGPKDKAKYSLLMAMALDKNSIVFNDSILKPAEDYYLKHGTPDEYMRTKYYQGVIYDEKKQYDAAFNCFLDAVDESSHEYKDSLGLALVYIGQATMYYKQYKIDEFIESSKKAAKIYESFAPQHHNLLLCYLKLIEGANDCSYPGLADSVYNVSRNKITPDHVLYPRLAGLRITSLIIFKPRRELKAFMDSIDVTSLETPSHILDLAWVYCLFGEKEKSWKYICKAETLPIHDSLKYLAMKSEVLDSLGRYRESEEIYKQFLDKAMEEEWRLRTSGLSFTEKKYNLQKELDARQIKIYRLAIGILSIILISLIFSFYFYWRKQKMKKRFTKEIERLNTEVHQLEKRIKDNTISDDAKSILRKRLDILNTFITEHIRDVKYENRSWKKLNSLINKDCKEFVDSTRKSFELSHPYFVRYLEGVGLTDTEINLACLYALGLRGKEAGNIIGIKSHYNISAEIRKKLGLYDRPNSMNLNKYLQSLILNE